MVFAFTVRATSEQSHIVPFNLHSRASRTSIPVLSPCVNDLPPVIVPSSDKSDSFPWEKDQVHCQSCLVDHLSDGRRFAPDVGNSRLLHVEGKSKFVCALWLPLGLLCGGVIDNTASLSTTGCLVVFYLTVFFCVSFPVSVDASTSWLSTWGPRMMPLKMQRPLIWQTDITEYSY